MQSSIDVIFYFNIIIIKGFILVLVRKREKIKISIKIVNPHTHILARKTSLQILLLYFTHFIEFMIKLHIRLTFS